jgi:ketosteroid isomerase-like protein
LVGMGLAEKTGVVRNLFDALGRGDFDAAVDCYDPEVEFDFSRSRGPNRGIYRGRHEIRKFWEEELGLWSEWLPEAQNFVEADVDTLTYSVRGE